MLVRGLPRESALAVDDNGGVMPLDITEHLLADTWVLLAGANSAKGKGPKDHPIREKQRKKATSVKAQSKRAKYEAAQARANKRIAGQSSP